MIIDRLLTILATDDDAGKLDLSRRTLLKAGLASGGGLLLSMRMPMLAAHAAASPADFVPNAFIRIAPSGQVTLTMPYVEMGQGTYTSIPMLIAEELEIELGEITLEHAPPDEKRYGNPILGGVQATGGSTTIRAVWQPLRLAGATARTSASGNAPSRPASSPPPTWSNCPQHSAPANSPCSCCGWREATRWASWPSRSTR